jgi:hypothetical protein
VNPFDFAWIWAIEGRETITVTNLYLDPAKNNLGRFSLRRIFPCVAFWVSRGGLLISLSRAAAEIKQLCIPFARN